MTHKSESPAFQELVDGLSRIAEKAIKGGHLLPEDVARIHFNLGCAVALATLEEETVVRWLRELADEIAAGWKPRLH